MPGYTKAIISLSLCLIASVLWGSLRKEFQALEKAYEQGKINELAAQMLNLKASSDDEKALILYLSAMLKAKREECLMQLQQAADKYPGTYYGQLAMLDMAKLHILERETAQARTFLNRINLATIPQRLYWLAVCAEMNDDPAGMISNAEAYLRLEPNGEFAEESYYLMTDAYIQQKKYQSAISNLGKMAAQPGLVTDSQYFHYLKGYAWQLSGNWQEAVASYRAGIDVARNTQVANLIEDRLFELKSSYGSRIELGFLFPYQELKLDLEPAKEDAIPGASVTDSPPPLADTPLRLAKKPSEGLWLQAGRFGVEANASSLAHRIRQLQLPANYFEDKSNKSMPWVTACGPFDTQDRQQAAMELLKNNQIDCFATRY